MKSSRPPGCEHCTQECTIHLTQIVDNKIKKIDMCEQCPNAKNIQDPNQFNLLSDLIKKPSQEEDSPFTLTCESCGYTEDNLKKTGRMGCAQCYETFSDAIKNMLAHMQKGSVHLGKVPAIYQKDSLRSRVSDLEKQLKEAIGSENYEAAAETRDQIRELREAIENPTEKRTRSKSS